MNYKEIIIDILFMIAFFYNIYTIHTKHKHKSVKFRLIGTVMYVILIIFVLLKYIKIF